MCHNCLGCVDLGDCGDVCYGVFMTHSAPWPRLMKVFVRITVLGHIDNEKHKRTLHVSAL